MPQAGPAAGCTRISRPTGEYSSLKAYARALAARRDGGDAARYAALARGPRPVGVDERGARACGRDGRVAGRPVARPTRVQAVTGAERVRPASDACRRAACSDLEGNREALTPRRGRY